MLKIILNLFKTYKRNNPLTHMNKNTNVRNIVSKLSRGNILLQNGHYLTKNEIVKMRKHSFSYFSKI